jgi:hypothetical protein
MLCEDTFEPSSMNKNAAIATTNNRNADRSSGGNLRFFIADEGYEWLVNDIAIPSKFKYHDESAILGRVAVQRHACIREYRLDLVLRE